MNRKQLANFLELWGISPTTYSLWEEHPVDSVDAICPEPDGWHVFFFERGERSSVDRFDTESEACAELLLRIAHDEMIRTNWKRGG